ncbi:hypothetical protein BCR39DRAFT_528419 [Naematelia encephala]|uniref:Zn(2)-C6 fungal-type domain-containing protein n=1 Tax=Naematelia encephala TaxID=71784 RepID=A0A1Y2B7I6_9TREE|nr:hypothetical protein BCR39DRAFT_528419 [Naematelia encephala]
MLPSVDSSSSSSPAVYKASPTETCDRCRRQKVRCDPLSPTDLATARVQFDVVPCRRCYRRKEQCRYDYRFKKPGRPSIHTSQSGRERAESITSSTRSPQPGQHREEEYSDHPYNLDFTRDGPAVDSLFGTARSAFTSVLQTPQNGQLENLGMGWSRSVSREPSSPRAVQDVLDTSPLAQTTTFPIQDPPRPPPLDFTLPPHPLFSPSILPPEPSLLTSVIPQIESIASWSEVCRYVSLFMKHQHSLVPLIHRPTFAQDVLHRRDKTDEVFRGLLFSLITYTICQIPATLQNPDMTRKELVSLVYQCQMASRTVQIRHQAQPSLVLAASVFLDLVSSYATTPNGPLSSILSSEASRLVFALELNKPTSSVARTPLDIELCRRLYWQVYCTDKTNAPNGNPLMLHNMEGTPPLPMEVDDEYLTHSSIGTQPPGTISHMTGFNFNVKLFQILGQCQVRHRTWLNDRESSPTAEALLEWVRGATSRLRGILDTLPEELREGPPLRGRGAEEAFCGIQKANVHITALCAEFALMDFTTILSPGDTLREEKERIAKKAFDTLSNISMEDVASNGEAMRGKVLRVILSLLACTDSPEAMGAHMWEWWNMFSRVQFIQFIPDQVTSQQPIVT